MGDLVTGWGILKLRDSGYYHFRRNSEQWAQWPAHRECVVEDCFGWEAPETCRLANRAMYIADLLETEEN